MKARTIFIGLLFLLTVAIIPGCGQKSALKFAYLTDPEIANAIRDYVPVYPEVRFAVFSDTHVYDTNSGRRRGDVQLPRQRP
jgi:hypothetical protein